MKVTIIEREALIDGRYRDGNKIEVSQSEAIDLIEKKLARAAGYSMQVVPPEWIQTKTKSKIEINEDIENG